MEVKFKKGQSVYDTAGYEYYYNQKLENGHLVNKIIEVQYAMQDYSHGGYDLNSEYQEGETIILYEVFDSPPKQKKCDEIVALDTAIKTLQEKESDIKKAILEKGKELARVKTDLENKIKEYPNHNMILNILSGNFPSFYINCDGVQEKGTQKIVIDLGTGQINSIYRDDYYSGTYTIGDSHTDKYFISRDDAEKAFIKRLNSETNILRETLEVFLNAKSLFEKYNEDIPEFIISGIKELERKEEDKKYNKLDSLRKSIQTAHENIKTYQDSIEELKKELGVE